jgi:predicted enzyme related to lactoylglutathione lyase
MEKNKPSFGHGKICYVEIPAVNIEESVTFYQTVFGWQIRKRPNGEIAFDDGVGSVSGAWVLKRKPVAETGLLVSIMVDDAAATLDIIVANGGKILQPIGMDLPAITAHFSDPVGNIWGIYQHGG